MRKIHWFLTVMLLTLFVFSGCKIPMEPTIKNISEFKLNGKNNGKKPGFGIGLEVHNPNKHKLKILAYDLDIFVGDKKLGNATRKGKQVLLKYSTSTLHFDIETDIKRIFTSIFGALSSLLGKDKRVDVHIKGTIVGKAHGIRKKIPVDYYKKVGFSK